MTHANLLLSTLLFGISSERFLLSKFYWIHNKNALFWSKAFRGVSLLVQLDKTFFGILCILKAATWLQICKNIQRRGQGRRDLLGPGGREEGEESEVWLTKRSSFTCIEIWLWNIQSIFTNTSHTLRSLVLSPPSKICIGEVCCSSASHCWSSASHWGSRRHPVWCW